MKRAFFVLLAGALVVTAAVPATASEQAEAGESAGPVTAEAPGVFNGVSFRPAPVKWFTQQLGHRAGHLSIPAIGVNEPILEGVSMSVINNGVAHWAGSADPGTEGNLVLAGHRTTYSRPFRDLDRLQPGDVIYASGLMGQVATYRVAETIFVTPDEMWIASPTGTPMLTMFACHPKGSARQRIVVRAELEHAPLIFP